MYPILFVIGPLTVYSFGFMLAAAVIVCSFLMSRDAVKIGIAKETVYDFAFWVAVSGIIGARIFYIFLNLGVFVNSPLELFQIQHGGLAWQGGLILGFAAAIFYLKKKNLPVFKFLDLASPYAALGQAIGRIGCFLNGCCYGQTTHWGLYFSGQHAFLHPAQIYESIGLVVIWLILRKLNQSDHPPGRTLVLYLMSAAVLRFIVQFFRYDYDPVFFGLGIFQWICVSVFVTAAFFLNYFKNRMTFNHD